MKPTSYNTQLCGHKCLLISPDFDIFPYYIFSKLLSYPETCCNHQTCYFSAPRLLSTVWHTEEYSLHIMYTFFINFNENSGSMNMTSAKHLPQDVYRIYQKHTNF